LVGSEDSPSSSQALTLITIVLLVAALYFGREVLIPLALALVFSFLLTPLVAWLERLHLSRIPAVLLVIALSLALFGLLGWIVTGQLMQITAQFPDYQANIHRKIQWIQGPKDGRLSKASDTIKLLNRELSTPEPEAPAATGRSARRELGKAAEPRPIPVQVAKPPSSALEYLRGLLGPLMSPLKTVGLVLVLTLFMLTRRPAQSSDPACRPGTTQCRHTGSR